MKIYKYIIVLSFFGLWLNSFIPSNSLYILGLFLILSFGILHGANDVVIISKSFNVLKNSSVIKIVSLYLIFVFLFSSFFYFIPDLALLIFVLISAYHFGEQHWERILKYSNTIICKTFQFLYGCLIFGLIFYFHQTETELIINNIIGYTIDLHFLGFVVISLCLCVMILSLYLRHTNRLFRLQFFEQLLYIIVLAIIFWSSDLIWSFTIYFVLWHSIPSLNDQIRFIYGKVSKKSLKTYIKQAFGYWLVSVSGLFVLFWFFGDSKIFEALLLPFIAAITFPHVLVISKMFSRKNT